MRISCSCGCQPSHSTPGGLVSLQRLQRSLTDDLEPRAGPPRDDPTPRLNQRADALLGRQSADEHDLAPAMIADSRILGEVRLDDDLVRRKAALDELAAAELGEGDVEIDRLGPRAHDTMHGGHAGHGERRGAAAAIATVHDGRPRYRSPEALLADAAVAIQHRTRTEQTIVVQRLHHGDAPAARGIVGSGRDQRKRVVKVRDRGCRRSPALPECCGARHRSRAWP